MFLDDLIETMSRIPTPRQVQAIAAPALRSEAEFLISGNVIAGHEACMHWDAVIVHRRFATTTAFFRTLTLIRCGLIHFMLHSPEIGEYELRKACACWERALEIAPRRFSQLGTLFSLLGSAYAQTYVLSSSPADLDRAIAVSELAISNTMNNCEALAM